MEELFKNYDELFQNMRKLKKDNLSRRLRVFDIRFRLALDSVTDYTGNYAYVKTKHVKETYVLLSKLMELWNSYEALYQYCKELGYSVEKSISENVIKSMEGFYEKTKSLRELKEYSRIFKDRVFSDDEFKKDFIEYIHRINICKGVHKNEKVNIENLRKYIFNEHEISGIEFLSLVYAERNMYYHEGEPGKMGLKYSNRHFLLKSYINTLQQIILLTSIYVLKDQIKKSSNQ